MLKRLVALFALIGFVYVSPADAEKRVALVIGNSAYVHAPALANPKNDAEGMAGALRRLKFEVIAGTDLDKPGMERALRQFSNAIERADVALVFYAGHGLQVNGRNYLIPVDAKLEKENDLRFDAVSLDDLQQIMELAQRVNIVILDACRDNPLARNLARSMGTRSTSIGRGLGETKAGVGTLIVYATQPGNVALDGEGRNSPFTKAMLKFIEEPGLEIRQVLTRVRNEVITSTRDRQVPWDSSSLRGDFYFMTAAARPSEPPPASPPTATPPRGPSAEFEALFWQSIKDSTNPADFKAYLERWPNGVFAPLARIRIAALERPQPQANRGAEADRKPDDSGRGQADVVARLARSRLDRAKTALGDKRYAEAKRLAAESEGLVKEAQQISAASSEAAAVGRDLKAFRLELDKQLSARVAVLLHEARALIDARKFGDADERLDEAEGLQPASATALRRQLESARADAGKSGDEAKRSLPEAARGQTAHSWYSADRKRGLLGFAYQKATLEPSAAAALDSLVASLRNQGDYRIRLYAGADRSEGGAGELPTLSRARLTAIQQYLTGKGIPAARLQTGIAAVRGEGPAQRVVTIAAEVAAPANSEDRPAAAPAPDKSADLLRRLTGAQWRGMVSGSALNAVNASPHSTIMTFRAGGVFTLVASRFGGARTSDPVPTEDRGSWSASNGRICVTLGRIGGGQQQCYTASVDEDGGVTLAGNGLLAGKRFSR